MTTPLGSRVPSPLQDIVLVAARVLLGVILIAHGWQKYAEAGIGPTADGFEQMGIPLPQAAAVFAASVEIGGGALLVLGLLTPLAGLLVAADMIGAFWFAHRGGVVFATEGGWELVAAIGAGALVIGAVGAGRLSLDHLIFGRRRSKAQVPDTVDA